jgi:hypothetical protein
VHQVKTAELHLGMLVLAKVDNTHLVVFAQIAQLDNIAQQLHHMVLNVHLVHMRAQLVHNQPFNAYFLQ